jgi:hypothetical protein
LAVFSLNSRFGEIKFVCINIDTWVIKMMAIEEEMGRRKWSEWEKRYEAWWLWLIRP